MIASIMLYGAVTAVLFTLAGFATERGLAALHLPRRGAWIVAMLASCVFPLAMMLTVTGQQEAIAARPAALATAAAAVAPAVSNTFEPAAFAAFRIAAKRVSENAVLDNALAAVWILGSIGLALFYASGWLHTRRAADRWKTAIVGGQSVSVGNDDVGPAVLGFRTPRIVVPRWLLETSDSFQRIVIQHERQHVRARDQLSLLLGLGLVVIAPWNLPLWWQLRRLRFAIEVDCDARVLRQGTDPLAYGEVLLQVGRHHVRGPITAVALIEPPTDLERRIRVLMSDGKRSVIAAIACLLMCASLVVAAAQLSPPQREPEKIALLSPQARLPARIQEILEAEHPEIFRTDVTEPVLVEMILGSRLEQELVNIIGLDEQTAEDEVRMRRDALSRGAKPDEPWVIDTLKMHRLSTDVQPTAAPIYVTYAIRTNDLGAVDAERTKATERALIERYFPRIADGTSNPHEQLWVVFDRNGHVVNAGADELSPEALMVKLNALHPGAAQGHRSTLRLSEVFDQEMLDTQGQPLLATLVWLTDLRVDARPLQLEARVLRNGELIETIATKLQPGKQHRYQGSQLRVDLVAQNVPNDTVLLGFIVQTPTPAGDTQGGNGWRTVTAPRLATKLGEQAAIEVGLQDPVSATPVRWRIEAVPTRVE